MDPLPFIIAAYLVTLGGLGGLLVAALRRMRRAERALEGAPGNVSAGFAQTTVSQTTVAQTTAQTGTGGA